jgi:hypothetical protein
VSLGASEPHPPYPILDGLAHLFCECLRCAETYLPSRVHVNSDHDSVSRTIDAELELSLPDVEFEGPQALDFPPPQEDEQSSVDEVAERLASIPMFGKYAWSVGVGGVMP